MANKKPLSRIKEGVFSRGLALAKLSVTAGVKAASHVVGNAFANESEKSERLKELLLSQAKLLSRELGQLKGSLMKVGQMLSMYGEHFLPAEANQFLKSLQNQSPPLEWKAIEPVIKKQFTAEQLAQIEINPEPLASASLGQVHVVTRKSDQAVWAMKIQYPGVDRAIEGDLKALKSILAVTKILPKGPQYDEIFKEVRQMLHQEVDYRRELKLTQEFQAHLADDSRYIIPQVIPEFSTGRILTTSFEKGLPIDSPEVLALPLARRNALGEAYLDLYFRELFEFGAVQTDPHFGNYRVRLGENGQADRLILFDFGAVRKLTQPFMASYLKMVQGAHDRNPEKLIQGGIALEFLRKEDSDEIKALFVELSLLITEPFFPLGTPDVHPEFFDQEGNYCFELSDLPKRVAMKGSQFALAMKLRNPPREIVFLDRKLGGIFIFLSVLKVRFQCRATIQKYFL